MSSIQEIATEAAGWFEVAYRVDGDTDSAYVRTRDDRPDWLTDIIHAAHGDMFPDDWRYAAIRSALEAIGEGSDEDDAGEWADSEVDVYNDARLAWLSSNLSRASYCDEAVDELGGEHDTFERIGLGQYFEASEVFRLVLQGLEARESELDEEEVGADAV